MTKWEYKIISEKVYDGKYLNSFGDEGWELCGVAATKAGSVVLYFKRKVCVCYSGPPD